MLGSRPPCTRSHPVNEVVVVFPCVPAITIERELHRKCSRTASGSEQYRSLRSRTASSSTLPREIALPTTTSPILLLMCSALYPLRVRIFSDARNVLIGG